MASRHIEKCSGGETFRYWISSQQYCLVHLKLVKRKDLMLRVLTIPKRIFYKNIELGLIHQMHLSILNLTSVCNTNKERYISSLPADFFSLPFFNQLLWVLRFATITMELSISHCSSISVCLLHVETLLSGTYVFRIDML